MRDKRPVDELSIEELERVLAIRKREARQGQLQRMKREGRVIVAPAPQPPPAPSPTPSTAQPPPEPVTEPDQAATEEQPAETPEPFDLPAILAAENPAKSPPPLQSSAIPRFEDETEGILAEELEANRASSAKVFKRFMNGMLVLVEIAAVFGLFYIGYEMLQATDELEAETRAAQQIVNATSVASIPTIAPTPTIRMSNVVLPTGHIIEDGIARPNFDEIPERYREQLRYEYSQPVLQRPTPTDNTALRVSIPALNIDEPITQGTDWEALKAGITQELNGFDPANPVGNVALAAHNDIYGQLFRDLDQLKPGDQIFIQTRTEVYTYEITHTEIVEPTDVDVLDSQGRPIVTLISCYPFGRNNKRIVVFAEQVDASA